MFNSFVTTVAVPFSATITPSDARSATAVIPGGSYMATVTGDDFEANLERIAKIQTYVSLRKLQDMAGKAIVSYCTMMAAQIGMMNLASSLCNSPKLYTPPRKAARWTIEFQQNLMHKATIGDLLSTNLSRRQHDD